MKILLTGCCGLLGQNLARAYLKKDWEVFGIDDLSSGTLEWLPKEVNFMQIDVCNQAKYLFGAFDLIIHLASRKIPRDGKSFNTLTQNTQGVLNMARYAMGNDSKFIYLSTSDVYGKNTRWDEEADLIMGQTDVMRWSYAATKIWGEHLLFSTPQDFDFQIVRLFGTYGPYHALSWTAGPQSVFISQALKQEPMTIHGDGKQERAYQYVDDAIDGIIKVAESDYSRQVFNIGNPNESISVDDLSRQVWKLINTDKMRPAKYVPQSSYKYEEIPNRIPDISKAKELLGFEPKIRLEEGLRRTIEWQRTVV